MVRPFKAIDEYLIPTSTRVSRTRKVNQVNRSFFDVDKLKTKTLSSVNPELGGSCIMFYLPDMPVPIELWNTAVILIGRRDSSNARTHLTIDLNDHHGALLGVSREHAKIVYRDDQYHVSDLNSTNGTWVNEKRVIGDNAVKLSNGDTLRLGHLMIQVGGYGSA